MKGIFFSIFGAMLTGTIYKGAQVLRQWGFDFHEVADPRVQTMRRTIIGLGGVQFSVEVDQVSKHWTAESTNIDGIITGGSCYPLDYSEQVKDAVFTYFEIPPYLCNDALLRGDNEASVIKEQMRVYVAR